MEEYTEKYGLEVRNLNELQEFLAVECPSSTTTVYINQGVNSDSGLETLIPEQKYLEGLKIEKDTMHDILAESRTVKNDEEIHVMRWASLVTCEAHCNVLRNCKAGLRECQLESFFDYHGQQKYFTGRVKPYLSICGCGPTAATLHYQHNDKTLIDGQTMLTD